MPYLTRFASTKPSLPVTPILLPIGQNNSKSTLKFGKEISRFWAMGGSHNVFSNAIRRYSVAIGAQETVAATMSVITGLSGSMQSSSKGYRAGGRISAASGDGTNTIDRLTYNTPETLARIGQTLYMAGTSCGSFLGDDLKGYLCGGMLGFGPNGRADAVVFSFSTEVSQSLGNLISPASQAVTGASGKGKGMFLANNYSAGQVGTIDFDTNTFSRISCHVDLGVRRASFSLSNSFYVLRGDNSSPAKINFDDLTQSLVPQPLNIGGTSAYVTACGGTSYAYLNSHATGTLIRFSDEGVPTSTILGSNVSLVSGFGTSTAVADGSPSF